jgi:CDGSH-type Zn-finger protein
MPTAIVSPTADAIEAILDNHPSTGTFEDLHPYRSGHTCRCGTKHPTDDHPAFPTHDQHLAGLIDQHFGTRATTEIVRVMNQHALGRAFTKSPHHREVEECRCGTQHPPFFDGRWATHRRHLAEQIAVVVTPAAATHTVQRVPARR